MPFPVVQPYQRLIQIVFCYTAYPQKLTAAMGPGQANVPQPTAGMYQPGEYLPEDIIAFCFPPQCLVYAQMVCNLVEQNRWPCYFPVLGFYMGDLTEKINIIFVF